MNDSKKHASQPYLSPKDVSDGEGDDWTDGDDFDDDFDDEDLSSLLTKPNHPDGDWNEFPGAETLWDAAQQLAGTDRLQVLVEIEITDSPELESDLTEQGNPYTLIFDICSDKVIYHAEASGEQHYLKGNGWPNMLRLPTLAWPSMTVLWDSLRVEQLDLRTAFRINQRVSIRRAELLEPAHSALTAAVDT